MDELQLIEGCRKGDRRAQKALYETFSRKMMSVCLRYVSDWETARDLLQEGFVKVFTHIDSYTGNGSFEGWIRKIFVNSALEYLRHADVLRESTKRQKWRRPTAHPYRTSRPQSSCSWSKAFPLVSERFSTSSLSKGIRTRRSASDCTSRRAPPVRNTHGQSSCCNERSMPYMEKEDDERGTR